MRTVSQRFERSAVLSPFSEAVSVPEFEDNKIFFEKAVSITMNLLKLYYFYKSKSHS